MRWLHNHRNWTNRTRSWQRRSVPLVLNLDTHLLNEIGVGDRLDCFAFLGPAKDWSNDLQFPDFGLLLTPDNDDCVHELGIFFGQAEEKSLGCFTGTVIHCGEKIQLSCFATEASLAARFAQPYWRDCDKSETVAFYEFGEREWQVEFGTDGCLKGLMIGRPSLADPQQRAAYGVPKFWPPV